MSMEQNPANIIMIGSSVVANAYIEAGLRDDILMSVTKWFTDNPAKKIELMASIHVWLLAYGYEIRKKPLDNDKTT